MRSRFIVAPFVALLAVAVAGCQPANPPPVDRMLVVRYGSAAWTTDDQALDAFLAERAPELVRPARDAELALRPDGTLAYTPAEAGVELDAEASRDALAAALAAGKPNAELVTRPVAPRVAEPAVAAARDQLRRIFDASGARNGTSGARNGTSDARNGTSGAPPMTLRHRERSWQLAPAEVARLLKVEGGSSAEDPARVVFDTPAAAALVKRIAGEVDAAPVDARLDWNGGQPRILRESRDGGRLDRDAAVELLRIRLLAGERDAELPVKILPPAIPSRDPRAFGVVELIERSTTSLETALAEKKWNVRVAAERLDGVLVPPGATFSFNDAIGPQTEANGFTMGYGIGVRPDGRRGTVPTIAGGLCQTATTLFHTVLWGGYPIEQRRSHSLWNPAYGARGLVGVDVAIDDVSGLDLKWQNTTDDYVLVQAHADADQVTIALYGKKPGWAVSVGEARVTNRRPTEAGTTVDIDPMLPSGTRIQVESARDGFDAAVTRTVTAPGAEPRTVTFRSHYLPSRDVVLAGPEGTPPA